IDVQLFVERRILVASFGAIPLATWNKTSTAITLTKLNPNVTKAVCQGFLERLETLLFGPAALMVIDCHRVMRLAAQQRVDRHTGAFSLDIPKGHIHGCKNVVVDGAIARIGPHLGGLAKVLDPIVVLAD